MILIPAFNEEKNIEKVVRDFKKLGSVVVCDNNSDDDTGLSAHKAGAKVVFEKWRGKGYAVRRLLLESSDVYVLVDGDGAFYAEDCVRMVDLIKSGKADMVIGKRVNINTHNKNSMFLRNVFLRLLKIIFRTKFGKVSDFMSGYRVFSDEVKQGLNLKSKGFEIETEVTIQALRAGFRVVEVPVRVKPRRFGKQKSNIFNVGFRVLKTIILS